MCKFVKSWVGKCKNEEEEGKEYCKEHLNVKCMYCGEQATKDCPETVMGFVCGITLCESKICNFIHFVSCHSHCDRDVEREENKLNKNELKEAYSKMINILEEDIKSLSDLIENKKGDNNEKNIKVKEMLREEIKKIEKRINGHKEKLKQID